MRYKTFRALVLGGVGVAALGAIAIYVATRGEDGGRDDRPRRIEGSSSHHVPARRDPPARRPDPVVAPPAAVAADDGGLRDVDQVVMARVDQPVRGGKAKDVAPSRPFKINLYQDAGESRPNRVKLDLDRDDRWDEKWTREADGWRRQVASADDEVYDRELHLVDDHWQAAPEAVAARDPDRPPPPEPVESTVGGEPLRPVDDQLLPMLRRSGPRKAKDVLRGRPYKVDLYQDAGQSSPNRVKLDLDRDGRWDEKWDVAHAGGELEIKRHVAPADDESYSDEYRLRAGRWVPKS